MFISFCCWAKPGKNKKAVLEIGSERTVCWKEKLLSFSDPSACKLEHVCGWRFRTQAEHRIPGTLWCFRAGRHKVLLSCRRRAVAALGAFCRRSVFCLPWLLLRSINNVISSLICQKAAQHPWCLLFTVHLGWSNKGENQSTVLWCTKKCMWDSCMWEMFFWQRKELWIFTWLCNGICSVLNGICDAQLKKQKN